MRVTAQAETAIAQEQWQAWFAVIPAKRSVLLFDTCESGSLTGERIEERALERSAAAGRLVQATGRTIISAAAGDQEAFEGFRNHGLFTYTLLEAIERADADGDGKLDVGELAAYIYAGVTSLSESVFKQRQVPQVRMSGGSYAVAKALKVLPENEPGIVLPNKVTHKLRDASDLLVQPVFGAQRVRRLDPGTSLTLVRTEGGFSLVARDGKPLGFIAQSGLEQIR